MKTAAAKRSAAEALIKAAKGKAPKGVALVGFREPTAVERRKGRGLVLRGRKCVSPSPFRFEFGEEKRGHRVLLGFRQLGKPR